MRLIAFGLQIKIANWQHATVLWKCWNLFYYQLMHIMFKKHRVIKTF